MRSNKYHAIKTTVNGVTFDSKREARRYQDLVLMQRAGLISDLVFDKKELRFDLTVNGKKVGRYSADFIYMENGQRIVEDVKSPASRTEAYMLRKRLMEAIHGINIREVN
jgi:hypothetical protein